MENLEQYKGKFIFSELVNPNGYEHKWLRRITRTTKTQVIADVQRVTDDYDTKVTKKTWYKQRAFRMNEKNGTLVERMSRNYNDESTRTVKLVDDFQSLKCKYSYEELFDTDIREIFAPDSYLIEMTKHSIEVKKERGRDIDEADEYRVLMHLVNDGDIRSETANHLKSLFGDLPVYAINSIRGTADTTNEISKFSKSAIHYHINHNGGDGDYISKDANGGNITISFWLFDDRIVIQSEHGIELW